MAGFSTTRDDKSAYMRCKVTSSSFLKLPQASSVKLRILLSDDVALIGVGWIKSKQLDSRQVGAEKACVQEKLDTDFASHCISSSSKSHHF
jgi:hypothetical protein